MPLSFNSRFGVAASDACQLVEPEKAKVVMVVEVSTAGRTQGEGAECHADIFEYICWRSGVDDWLTSIDLQWLGLDLLYRFSPWLPLGVGGGVPSHDVVP